MAGFYFSDTTNKQGLLQALETDLNFPDAGISGDALLPFVFTRSINAWLQRLVTQILLSQDDWTWDDVNQGYYPVASRSMVANQQDYKFSSAAWSLLTSESTAFTFAQNPTITIATPGVITFANHGLSINDKVSFSTTGALPTGITAGNTYYVILAGYTVNSFEISSTLGGSAINTTGSQSGTHSLTRQINPFRVQRVEFSFDSGASWYRANPLHIDQIGDPTDATDISANFPVGSTQTGNTGDGQVNFNIVTPFYELRSNALWLYPIPSSISTNGIKIWFDRAAIEFVPTDTLKQPPIDADFHEILHLGPAYDYAVIKNLPQAAGLKGRLDERMQEFALRYGSKDQDIHMVVGSIYSDQYGS